MKPRTIVAAVVLTGLAPASMAWDAHGHRVVTLLAMDAMMGIDKPAPGATDGRSAGMPLWLTEPKVRAAVAYQSGEPDRIRAQQTPQLVHMNEPDHYIDVEMLKDWDLTLQTIPALRHQFIKAMTLAREKHPERFADYKPEADKNNVHEWPGLAPYAVLESYGNLQASFRTIKIIELLGVTGRENQLEQAKQNAIVHMGRLSHFVGDLAQPLHTTIHHHGWVGPNPEKYTTDGAIHSWIDGGAISILKIEYEPMMASPVKPADVNAANPWNDVIAEITRSHQQVETVYKMHKDGSLLKPEGKAFLEERLRDGASVLAALYRAAWETSDPAKQDIDYFTYGTPPENQPSIPPPTKRPPPARDADEAAAKKSAKEAGK